MPWERGAAPEPTTEEQAESTLFGLLADDPSLGGEKPRTRKPEQSASDDESDESESEGEESADEESEPEEEDESGEEEEASDDEESDDAAPAKLRWEIEGQTVELTEDEAKAGYLRQQDYTRKTMAVAEERKAAAAVQAQANQARDAYAQRLALVEQALAEAVQPQQDWDKLRLENPSAFAVQWAEHSRRQSELAAVQAERQRIFEQQREEAQKQHDEHLTRERELLVAAIPEWKDKAKAAGGKREVYEYAQSLGYTADDLGKITDHRVMLILRRAMLYDRATAKGKAAIKGAQKKPATVLQPGPAKSAPAGTRRSRKADQQRMDRLARTGNVNDAAAFILGRLGDDD